jgi:hypothetical protein
MGAKKISASDELASLRLATEGVVTLFHWTNGQTDEDGRQADRMIPA